MPYVAVVSTAEALSAPFDTAAEGTTKENTETGLLRAIGSDVQGNMHP